MNYNQGPRQGQNTQQLYARQGQQGQQPQNVQQRMSMLPPQFQNLSPQELQELKNQPQFQNALRQYYQRQQISQQQMRQGGMGQSMGVNQGMGSVPQNMGQNMNINQNMGQNMGQNINQNMGQSMGQSIGQNMGLSMGQNMGHNVGLGVGQNLGAANMAYRGPQQKVPQQQQYNINAQQAYWKQQQQAQQVQQLQQTKMQPMNANVNAMNSMNAMNRSQMAATQGNPSQAQMAAMYKQMQSQQQAQYTQREQIPGQAMASSAAMASAMVGGQIKQPGPHIGGRVSGGYEGTSMGKMVPGAMGVMPAGSNTVATAAAAAIRGGASAMPPVSMPSPDPATTKAAASMVTKETVKLPPRFAPDSVSKVHLRPLKSATEWSDTLKAEGEEVPLDVKVYESIIKKDEKYLRKTAQQSSKQNHLVEKMALDIKAYNTIKQLRMNSISASAKNQYNNSIWGEGYQGYGNGVSNATTQVILPHQNKSFTKVPAIPYTESQMNEKLLKSYNTGKPRHLVPIRLDFDKERDRFKLRDTFLWDINDETYPIENFVRTLIEDYKFILDQHYHTVLAAVNEQIKDYKKKPDKTMGEIRVPIKIDLVINNTQFTDQFEWDLLNSGESDPEDFASILCEELSLPGECATAIAFSIREQAQLYHKALFLVGYSFDGSLIREDEIRSHLLPTLRMINAEAGNAEDFVSTLRNPGMVAEFSPSIGKLTQLEIEKIDKEMERELRRRRRHFASESAFTYNENSALFGSGRGTASRRNALHSGRGVKTALPDLSDIPKNFRTPMPSSVLPGGIDLGVPDIYGYNELVINRTQIKNPDYKPPAPPGMVTSFRDSTGSFYVKILFSRRRH